ncbi:MAG: NHL repeat-containing protein [Actinomycetes bacterium]|jgi:sugar lactone lactonase YvrE|nr:NHL repeat-containing protein [Actinomycetes bacterium]
MSASEPAHNIEGEQLPRGVNKRGRVLAISAIVVLIILLLLVCAWLLKFFEGDKVGDYDTRGITWINSVYAFGPNPDQVINPASCAIADNGSSFWVTDQSRRRIVEFNWNGSFKALFDRDTSGTALSFPSDITVAPDGWMYVCEQTYHHVLVFDPDRELRQTLQIPNPMSVAANDEMVVVGARSGFVAWDRQGKLIGYVGQRGNSDDSFDTINGIAIDRDSNVYVVDTYNNRLSKYNRDGDRVWMVRTGNPANQGADVRNQSLETTSAGMQQPMGCTIDAAGRIVIIDGLDFSVNVFSSDDGKFLAKYGVYGNEEGQFAYSSDIAYDSAHDYFVVADAGNERAQIIKIPGSGGGLLAALRANLAGPLGICCIPLLIILLLLGGYGLWRYLQRRRQKLLAGDVDRAGDTADSDPDIPDDDYDTAQDLDDEGDELS